MPSCKLVVSTSMCSRPSASRHRKQRFPRLDRRRSYGNPYLRASPLADDCVLSEDEHLFSVNKRFAPVHKPHGSVEAAAVATAPLGNSSPTADTHGGSLPVGRADRRARDEHNEQERNRRRELAVIYELIRCSFSEDDLRYLYPCNTPTSIEKMSYPQVLHVAYHLLREEQHNLIMFERTLNDIRRIEKEFTHAGIPLPERPSLPSITETYLNITEAVDKILKYDKSARAFGGVYEVTPAERAALGDRQLAPLCPRSNPVRHNPIKLPTRFSRLNSHCARQSVRSTHKPRHSEFPRLTYDEEMSRWDKMVPKLRRSSSSASITRQTSDSEASYLQEYSAARYACKPEDAVSLVFGDSCVQPENDPVVIDFLPQ